MNIKFFEKPGCINNTRQKALLIEKGHQVEAESLLTHTWKAETLRPFFGDMPVARWFNPTAPRIKRGEVNPALFSADEAIAAMLIDHLLIRRPLMDVEGQLCCGFDNELVYQLLNNADVSHLQTCPNLKNSGSCDD